ncbi:hypothetical protein K8R04_03100 [Candidatus Uhrbacteria bacterium]|nr:hypothetical protein [Candidatus Uhrbacteria bacterium]
MMKFNLHIAHLIPTKQTLLVFAGIFLACFMPLSAYAGYSQGYYQGTYYGQSYYQAAYTSIGTLITGASYAPGAGGYSPGGYTYWGGGGGGGLVLNGSSVSGESGPSSPGNGGYGYGGGGGGASLSDVGGAGAPGVVYVEWNAPPASCAVSITPNPATYSSTGTATLTWSSTDADSWTQINNAGTFTGSSGSFTVPRTATTNYSCYAMGPSGSDGWHSAILTVTAPNTPTASIASSIGSSMRVGDSTTITATFTGASGDPITAANIDSPVGTGLAANTTPGTKTYTFTPTSAGTYTFYARAQTTYYTSWATYNSVTVTVTNPAPTCTLSVSPSTVTQGQYATLSWTSTYATSGTISPTVGSVSPVSSGSTSVSPQTSTTYTGSFTGAGGTASCNSSAGVTLTVTCPPLYSCSGNDVTYTNSSCAVSTVASCASPSTCTAGQLTCQWPAITTTDPGWDNFPDGFDGHIIAQPQIIKAGERTRLYWNVENAESCTVTGGGQTWSGLSSGSAGVQTNVLVVKTTYTLHCAAYTGNVDLDEDTDVIVTPKFRER